MGADPLAECKYVVMGWQHPGEAVVYHSFHCFADGGGEGDWAPLARSVVFWNRGDEGLLPICREFPCLEGLVVQGQERSMERIVCISQHAVHYSVLSRGSVIFL